MATSSYSTAVLPLLALVVLSSVLSAASAASADKAFLVVDKRATVSKVKSSERVTVSISLHNAGTSTAYDVSLNDNTWPENLFTVITGNTSQTWEKLDAGASLGHSFVLEPKVKGPFSAPRAVVKYKMAAKSVLQEAYSTPVPELDIYSDKPAANKFLWIKEFGVKYGPLMIVLSLLGAFTLLLVSPSKSKKATRGSKRRR